MKKIYAFIILNFIFNLSYAQTNFWKKSSVSTDVYQIIPKNNFPKSSVLFDLNLDEFSKEVNNQTKSNAEFKITIPNANGEFNTYLIREYSNFHPTLQQKHQSIKALVGYNIHQNDEKINLSISPQFGLYGQITGNGYQYYIDAYTLDNKTYIVYDRKNLPKNPHQFNCHANNEQINGLQTNFSSSFPKISAKNGNGNLKTYRLALSTTTEYSNFIINRANAQYGTEEEKKEAILAAINISLTRINSVFRNDVGVHFELIPNTDALFFINTDDFVVSSANQMLFKNIEVTNTIIGAENYDIGHLFFKVNSSSQSNGLAITPSVCVNDEKAGGVTGTVLPIGDPFDIDYTAHEIGHQLGAYHTQNNGCNRMSTSVEPGSGSTIMAYTGICHPNIQANSDAYFHQVSINQMQTIIQNSECGTLTTSTNNYPIITAAPSSYNIPHSTPFSLKLNATDTDFDHLTYTWDQIDPEVGEQMPPVSNNTQGPMFRSILPSPNPERFFPKMENILQNKITFDVNNYTSNQNNYHLNNWEVVPNNARTLLFSGLVRDNNSMVGLTNYSVTEVNLQPYGPFSIITQSSNEIWNVGESVTINWEVAQTNQAPINTQFVKILLSTDGGIRWNKTLVDSTPNNGSYTFTIPSDIISTTNARIMIRPVDNIYLAVNKSNFTINNNLSTIDRSKTELNIYPNPTNGWITLSTNYSLQSLSIDIFDTVGRKIKSIQSETNHDEHKIDLSDLSNGIYFIKTTIGAEEISQKLIIKK